MMRLMARVMPASLSALCPAIQLRRLLSGSLSVSISSVKYCIRCVRCELDCEVRLCTLKIRTCPSPLSSFLQSALDLLKISLILHSFSFMIILDEFDADLRRPVGVSLLVRTRCCPSGRLGLVLPSRRPGASLPHQICTFDCYFTLGMPQKSFSPSFRTSCFFALLESFSPPFHRFSSLILITPPYFAPLYILLRRHSTLR